MKRYQLLAGIAALVLTPGLAKAFQERAGDEDQKQIEIAAARYFSASDSQKYSLKEFSLDPRLYVRGLPRVGSAPEFKLEVFPKIEFSSIVATSHSKEHLESLAQILSTNGILADEGLCTPAIPDTCRLAGKTGIVTFSVAWLRGDVAELMMSLWSQTSRVHPVTRESLQSARSFSRVFTLTRSGRSWVVSNVRMIS